MKDPTFSSMSPNMSVSSDVMLISQLSIDENPFAEYMWMENEEDFDRQVEEELWEEEFIEHCFQVMLEEEQWEWFIPSRDLPAPPVGPLQEQLGLLGMDSDLEVAVHSNLNPYAKEFTPGIQNHAM